MFTSEDIEAIITNCLQLKKFHVLRYDFYSTKSQLKIKLKTGIDNKTTRNVLFNIKQSLSHPQFQGTVCRGFIENFNLNLDLTPTYFIKGVFVYEDKSDEEFIAVKTPDLDPDHIKVILRTMARYHGETLGFEEKKSAELGESFRLPNEYPMLLKAVQETDEDLLKSLGNPIKFLSETKVSHEEIESRLTTIIQNSVKRTREDTFRKVLCFGDLCTENILFQYQDGFPVRCKFVNFSQQHYSPPAYDVLQLIYAVSCKEFRQHHLHELLEFYYDCFKGELEKRGLAPDKIISLEDFEISTHYLLPLIKLQLSCTRCLQSDTKTELLMQSVEELKDLVMHDGLSLEDCFKIIKNKIGTTDYNLLEHQMIPLGKVSGFFGDHKKLKIKIQVNNEQQILNFFVKFTPKGKAQKSIADDFGSFYKENFFYRHFVTKAEKFSSAINDCTVPCYFTRLNDVMVFEDFEVRNYGILDHRKPLTYDLVEVIVKKLAKLHASSIILEEKLSEQTGNKFRLNEHYEQGLKESFFSQIPNHQGAKSTEISIVAVKDQIRLFPDPNSQLSDETFREKLKAAYDLAYELVKPSKEFRNVICHGDLWINNILVQQINGKATDCRFIDFQIVRYCPPAHDLLGFLYLATNRSFRKKHFQEVIDLYYEEFAGTVKNSGCDVENIYSYERFKESIDYMLPQTVCQTAIYYHICLTDPDLMKDYVSTEDKMKQIFLVDRRDFIAEMCERDPIYKERNKEAIEDLRDLCSKYF